MTIYLNDLGLACALGSDKKTVLKHFLAGDSSFMKKDDSFGIETVIGQVTASLPSLSDYGPYQNSRNNQLALLALSLIHI